MASNENVYRNVSLVEKQLKLLNDNIQKFKSGLSTLNLSYKQTDKVVVLINELIEDNENSIIYLLQNTQSKPEKIVNDILRNSQKQLRSMDSHYKR